MKLKIILVLVCMALSGFAASILYQNINEKEARLVRLEGDPTVGGAKLTRVWPWIVADAASGATVKELVTAANAITTYTNPQANSHTYTGVWVNSRTWAVDEFERGGNDRGAAILQLLSLVNTVGGTNDLVSLGYRDIELNEILRLFSLEEGEGDRRWCIWPNISPDAATRSQLMDTITDSELVTQFAPGWEYRDREYKEQDDGSIQFTVEFGKAAWDNVTGAGINKQIDSTNKFSFVNFDPETELEGLDVRKVVGADGVPTDDAQVIITNIAAESGWAIDGISLSDRGDGSTAFRITQTKHRSTNDFYYASFSAAVGRRPEAETIVWNNMPAAEAGDIYGNSKTNQAAMASATPPAPASHRLQDVSVRGQGNGLRTVTRTTWIPYNTGDASWPENTETYSNKYVSSRSFQWIGTNQYFQEKFVWKEVDYHATYDAAWNSFDDAITYERGSGVRNIGGRRWIAERITFSSNGVWNFAAERPTGPPGP